MAEETPKPGWRRFVEQYRSDMQTILAPWELGKLIARRSVARAGNPSAITQ